MRVTPTYQSNDTQKFDLNTAKRGTLLLKIRIRLLKGCTTTSKVLAKALTVVSTRSLRPCTTLPSLAKEVRVPSHHENAAARLKMRTRNSKELWTQAARLEANQCLTTLHGNVPQGLKSMQFIPSRNGYEIYRDYWQELKTFQQMCALARSGNWLRASGS